MQRFQLSRERGEKLRCSGLRVMCATGVCVCRVCSHMYAWDCDSGGDGALSMSMSLNMIASASGMYLGVPTYAPAGSCAHAPVCVLKDKLNVSGVEAYLAIVLFCSAERPSVFNDPFSDGCNPSAASRA